MKTFKFVALPSEIADAARRAAAAGASDHAVMTADSPAAYPCRHCLRWAKPGERVVLFPYTSVPSGHPYNESGPIFVHLNRCRRYQASGEYPAEFRTGRVFRAYDANYNMIDAVIPNGAEPEAVIEKMFQNRQTAFVQARSASHGCFTFQVKRA